MARRLLLKENGLQTTGQAPSGVRYIGYVNEKFSERTTTETSEIASGSYYHSDGNILDNLTHTATFSETAFYTYKIPAGFYNVGDLMTTGPSILTIFTYAGESAIMRAYWSYTQGGTDNLVEQLTLDSYYSGAYAHLFNSATASSPGNQSGFSYNPTSKIISNTELLCITEQNSQEPYNFIYATSSIPDISKDIYFTLTFEKTVISEVNYVLKLGLVRAIRDIRSGSSLLATSTILNAFSETPTVFG